MPESQRHRKLDDADTGWLSSPTQHAPFGLNGPRLKALAGASEALIEQREVVLSLWFEHCQHRVMAWSSGSLNDFESAHGRELDGLLEGLKAGEPSRCAHSAAAAAAELCARQLPFHEAVAIAHGLEQAVRKALHPHFFSELQPAFSAIHHLRLSVLGDAYLQCATGQSCGEFEPDDHAEPTSFHGLVGSSSRMQAVYDHIRGVATGRGAVLIVGDSGTGKELVARALHAVGRKPDSPFVAINCAALPRELIESELFGYEKGTFTGSATERRGLMRAAGHGTILLDEITEMPRELQPKLLRALEQRAVRPVGASQEIPIHARFVASTNRDPMEAVESGQLRHDLFYRLCVYRLDVPALRERSSDIPELVDHLLRSIHPEKWMRYDREAMDALEGYTWPGNVRELRNVVEHTSTVCSGDTIRLSDLPSHILRAQSRRPPSIMPIAAREVSPVGSLGDMERVLVLNALEQTAGNKAQAARLLGISRHQLYTRLEKLRDKR